MATEDLFNFAPHVFNRIVVRRIGRQIKEAGTGCLNGFAHALDFVGSQIIHDDHISFLERRPQALADPSQKHLPIHRPLKEPRGASPAQADAGNHRGGLIMSVRNAPHRSLAFGRSCSQSAEFGGGPAFIDKHQSRDGFLGQLLMPLSPLFGDVGSVLFGGE